MSENNYSKIHYTQLRDSLRGIGNFKDLPENLINEIGKSMTWREYPDSHLVIEAKADRPHGVFFLFDGEVEIFREARNNARAPVARRRSVDLFGEIGAISGTPGSASVITTMPSRIGELPAEQFLELLKDFPMLAVSMLQRLAGSIRNLDLEVERMSLAEHLLERLHTSLRTWT